MQPTNATTSPLNLIYTEQKNDLRCFFSLLSLLSYHTHFQHISLNLLYSKLYPISIPSHPNILVYILQFGVFITFVQSPLSPYPQPTDSDLSSHTVYTHCLLYSKPGYLHTRKQAISTLSPPPETSLSSSLSPFSLLLSLHPYIHLKDKGDIIHLCHTPLSLPLTLTQSRQLTHILLIPLNSLPPTSYILNICNKASLLTLLYAFSKYMSVGFELTLI